MYQTPNKSTETLNHIQAIKNKAQELYITMNPLVDIKERLKKNKDKKSDFCETNLTWSDRSLQTRKDIL